MRISVIYVILAILAVSVPCAVADDSARYASVISEKKTFYSYSREDYVLETFKIIENLFQSKIIKENYFDFDAIDKNDLINLGTPVYNYIFSKKEHGDSKFIKWVMSRVVEYDDNEGLVFDSSSDRSAVISFGNAFNYFPKIVKKTIKTAFPVLTVKSFSIFQKTLVYNRGDTIETFGRDVRVSLHELGHSYEYSNYGFINKAKSDFYAARTAGKPQKRLNTIPLRIFAFFIKVYPDNYYFKEGFIENYMGKTDGEELFSCGISYVFFNGLDIWERDPESVKFILGSLILSGAYYVPKT
ncbi:hypothetical protein AGMMS49957_08930 [Synergistales bacterium]|nr:hypothetical protein AGMMS49957_08930 [Synergistales bacterium]